MGWTPFPREGSLDVVTSCAKEERSSIHTSLLKSKEHGNGVWQMVDFAHARVGDALHISAAARRVPVRLQNVLAFGSSLHCDRYAGGRPSWGLGPLHRR